MTTDTAKTIDLLLAEEPRLRWLANRLTRCAADADDLVQTTLLKAYAARDRFEVGSSIGAWTATILRRTFLTRVSVEKRRRTQLAVDAGADDMDGIPGPDSRWTPEPSLRPDEVEEELSDDLKRALARVPEVYRRSFFLHALAGMSCAEIAGELAVPEGTVMSRIHRAREMMRRDLAGSVCMLTVGRTSRSPNVFAN